MPILPEAGRFAKHGTPSEYSNHKCRCAECRAAITAYMASWRARKRHESAASRELRASIIAVVRDPGLDTGAMLGQLAVIVADAAAAK